MIPGSEEQAPETCQVRFDTSQGSFTVEITRAWAPLGADRFHTLVKGGFFDGARFFRVLPGFVVQFGIPADPQVARSWRSARIADDPVKQSNSRGSITFATSGPNSRTTQVFINLADNRNLDSMGFAPFGRVVEGMEVVEKLHSGYGEGAPHGRGPDQGRIQSEGNAYLEKSFPKLDSVIRTAIL
jgi:peptidyl-prolyl cis-trans isomerase A (cyclophilin A)